MTNSALCLNEPGRVDLFLNVFKNEFSPSGGILLPAVTRRERHKQQRLERIKAAAWELFTTQGYEQTTIRQISDLADVGVGTVNVLGGDKAGLLIKVFQEIIQTRLGELTIDEGAPLEDRIYDALNHFLTFYEDRKDLLRHYLRETLYGNRSPEELQEELARSALLMSLIAGWIVQEQEAGKLRPEVNPQMFSQSVFSSYMMVLQSWLTGFYSLDDLRQNMRLSLQNSIGVLRPTC